MTRYVVRVRMQFWDDLRRAVDYYNEQSGGLGLEFAQDVMRHIRLIIERPEMYRNISPNLRRALISRFQQRVVFGLDGNRLYFIGIVHGTRDFEAWLADRS